MCNSTHRVRPPYGVQGVPFRVRPGPPRDTADGVQGVQFGAPCTPPYGVQAVPFRVRPGPPRDAPDGVQSVQVGAPGPSPIRCARCAIRRAGPAPHTVCKLCHSGYGPDLRGMRPTVCKLCNSAHRAATGHWPLATGDWPPTLVCKLCHSGCGPDFHETRPTVCKVCKSAHRAATGHWPLATGHRRPTLVCKLCHSGRGPDFHETRPTVCKVCNSPAPRPGRRFRRRAGFPDAGASVRTARGSARRPAECSGP